MMTNIYYVDVFFFFQAEDGIRDIGVTGVQTCALPICGPAALHRLGRGHPAGLLRAAGRARDTRRAGGGNLLSPESGAGWDRKSVVEGKSVDLGGRRIIKKKKNYSICRQVTSNNTNRHQ